MQSTLPARRGWRRFPHPPSSQAECRRGRVWRPAELDFNHFHLRALRLFGKAPRVEMAVGGAAAEIAAAQLPHQIAVVFPVIAADAALTGVVVEIALGRTEVERADGIGGERAEAHSRNVKDRRGVGLAAVGAADGDAETGRVGGFHRPHGVADALIAGLVDIQQGAERLVAHLVFARRYTSVRWVRENGISSLSCSRKYWRSSGRMNSKKKRRRPMIG